MEKYSRVDDIMRDFNNMAEQSDVWKLSHNAHGFVVTSPDIGKLPFALDLFSIFSLICHFPFPYHCYEL